MESSVRFSPPLLQRESLVDMLSLDKPLSSESFRDALTEKMHARATGERSPMPASSHPLPDSSEVAVQEHGRAEAWASRGRDAVMRDDAAEPPQPVRATSQTTAAEDESSTAGAEAVTSTPENDAHTVTRQEITAATVAGGGANDSDAVNSMNGAPLPVLSSLGLECFASSEEGGDASLLTAAAEGSDDEALAVIVSDEALVDDQCLPLWMVNPLVGSSVSAPMTGNAATGGSAMGDVGLAVSAQLVEWSEALSASSLAIESADGADTPLPASLVSSALSSEQLLAAAKSSLPPQQTQTVLLPSGMPAPDLSMSSPLAVSAAMAQMAKSLADVAQQTATPVDVDAADAMAALERATVAQGVTSTARTLALTPQQTLLQAGVMAEKLAAQIVWMQSQSLQRAELRLNPAELGQLQVQLDIQRDQASVNVSSPHAHVREWLDAGQGRLREMLGQSGLSLGTFTVAEQLPQQHGGERGDGRGGRGGNGAEAGVADDHDQIEAIEPVRVGVGLVDSYA